LAFPEDGAVRADDAGRVEHRADGQVVTQRAGQPERDERPLWDAVRGTEPDQRRANAGTARRAQLGRGRTGQGQPVSVHAVLRTVSLRLFVASNAAEGSNPEWIPQCSQRGSLPGPYSSHSIPSISAS